MHPLRLRPLALLTLVALGGLALPAHSQSTRSKPSLIVFKDGFTLHGRIEHPTTYFVDPASKQSLTIRVPGGFYTVDDGARSIAFSPGQLHNIIPDDDAEARKAVPLNHPNLPSVPPYPMPAKWTLESVTAFDQHWERVATISTDKDRRTVRQRLAVLTPRFLRLDARDAEWYSYYLTRELTPEHARTLIYKHMAMVKKPEKEVDRRLLIYRFLLQAGWTSAAEQELEKMITAFPGERAKLKELRDGLDRLLNHQYIAGIELAHKVGQHQEALERLTQFTDMKMAALATPKGLVKVQELKNKYEAAGIKLKAARRFLEALPPFMPPVHRDWTSEAATTILNELNFDTLPRLEIFISQSLEWERARKASRAPTQVPEDLLAYAVSGWLLGDNAAEKSFDRAKRLWEARQMVLEVQKNGDPVARRQRAASFEKDKFVTPDVVARMIPLLPPPEPHEKPDTDPIKLQVAVEGAGRGGTYHVQLPPEYNHVRPYPVLIALHHSADKPTDTLQRWSTLAAQHGYILVAPAWGRVQKGGTYGYSAKEHALVLDCLRDLRRRFQVDSDRVFLFGCEQGGRMAFDVGLSHPDQFAGVLPMSAAPRYHGFRYWTHAQYVPFYVVNGDNTGEMKKDNRTLFKDWIKRGYPALSLEYRGRPAEWFEAELELMIDWMDRKKRLSPQKEVGWADEFRTMRETDNRFYWLGTEAIQPRCLNGVGHAWNKFTQPATLQARIFNDNQINVKTSGLNQVTIWLGPGMLNYEQKVKVFLNQRWWGPQLITPSLDVMLEEFTRTGDRQRLFWARIPLKT